jgi:hypothetical protein
MNIKGYDLKAMILRILRGEFLKSQYLDPLVLKEYKGLPANNSGKTNTFGDDERGVKLDESTKDKGSW